ncbi:MAG: PEP/pyruvate-binding domain-containing protein, partial [bacterium]
TKDKNQMIIEAGYGLGEALVSGQITPDSYVVNKCRDEALPRLYNDEFEILDINIAEQKRMLVRKNSISSGIIWKPVLKTKQEKQKLNNKQIIELAKICRQIEQHYKKPQDIEWAFSKGKFYITQSRPITTL